MGYFLYDSNNCYSYELLLNDINSSTTYIPYQQTSVLYDYFTNLIKALIANKPLLLIDSDCKANDIPSFDFEHINKPQNISFSYNRSIDDLINAIQNSTSEISIYTSGTTGQPKRVSHSIGTLTRSVRIGVPYENNVWAYAFNPTHMAGLQVFFQGLLNKNTFVNVFGFDRNAINSSIEKYKITHISATPTFYKLLLPFENVFTSVQRVTLGGEKSDRQLYDSLHNLFPNAKINNVYASTEAGTLFASNGDVFTIPINLRDKFRVENDELFIHKSLLGNSNGFVYIDDYYPSGDLIEWIDFSKGTFRFKSRKNELINVGGYKVNPFEVEEAINSIQGVQQSIVYGRPNSILGNVIVAEVKLFDGVYLTSIDIRKILSNKLQDFKIPRKINLVDELLQTKTGKLKRL